MYAYVVFNYETEYILKLDSSVHIGV